jgi:AcrR family transcriptional regulator
MSKTNQSQADSPESPVPSKPLSIRDRVLAAAFDLFREHGFSSTSMLDIVTRARVSKRDLYALFKKKHAVLAAYLHRSPEGRQAQRDSARTRRASTTKVLHWTRTGEQRILVCPTLGQKWGEGGDNENVETNQPRTKKHRSNRVWTRKIDASSLNEAARTAAETARGSFERDSANNNASL